MSDLITVKPKVKLKGFDIKNLKISAGILTRGSFFMDMRI